MQKEVASGNPCIRAAADGLVRIFMGNLKPLAGKYEEDEDLLNNEDINEKDLTPETSETEDIPEAPPAPSPMVRTVYLVRHGEAVHNVLENEAKIRAAAEAEALGHAKGSEAYKTMVEMAQRAVLHDAKQVDPPLSPAGIDQAVATNAQIKWLSAGPMQLPEPGEVFVSPLQRTLQTAASVFPDHPRVRVHELVQERRTGLPCDEPSPQREMCQQKAFSYMDFGSVLQDDLHSQDDAIDALPAVEKFSADPRRCKSETAVRKLEDAPALRLRTAMLGQLLRSVEDEAVCVISHKGYLRELERGTLGKPEAALFATCEVRVYEVSISPDGQIVDATLRYRRDLHGDAGGPVSSSVSKA